MAHPHSVVDLLRTPAHIEYHWIPIGIVDISITPISTSGHLSVKEETSDMI
jgi:hypothetical protein